MTNSFVVILFCSCLVVTVVLCIFILLFIYYLFYNNNNNSLCCECVDLKWKLIEVLFVWFHCCLFQPYIHTHARTRREARTRRASLCSYRHAKLWTARRNRKKQR
jgi:hypothetical protein